MDIFCEYLVEKKSSSDKIKKHALTLACIIFLLAVFYFCVLVKPRFVALVPILWGGAIFGTVVLRRNFAIEYEYIFTNGVLDIDVIKGRARRKNLVSIPCKSIEYMAPMRNNFSTDRKIIDAIYNEKLGRKYYVNFTQGGVAHTLLFQPPEKILDNMKKYNPRNIEL